MIFEKSNFLSLKEFGTFSVEREVFFLFFFFHVISFNLNTFSSLTFHRNKEAQKNKIARGNRVSLDVKRPVCISAMFFFFPLGNLK